MFDLSGAKKLALHFARPKLEARRVLAEHGPKMSADSLYDWVLKATGSAEQAEKAHNEKRRAQLKAGQVPE